MASTTGQLEKLQKADQALAMARQALSRADIEVAYSLAKQAVVQFEEAKNAK